jgi:DNA replication protein DnaC
MSNSQYDEVVAKARDYNLSLNRCPTCGQKPTEIEDNTGIYKLDSKEYPCDCEAQVNLARHYLLANVPPDYWTLSDIEFVGDSEALKQAQDYLGKYDNYKAHGIGIEFYSTMQGTGKTMLSCIIAKELVKRGEHVYFIHFDEILRLYQMPYEQREELERKLRRVPVLILDEIGRPVTDAQRAFFATELESLIRHRTSGNGITIITTNMTPGILDKEYPRTASLLAKATIEVAVSGDDIRKEGTIDLYRKELALNGETKPIS